MMSTTAQEYAVNLSGLPPSPSSLPEPDFSRLSLTELFVPGQAVPSSHPVPGDIAPKSRVKDTKIRHARQKVTPYDIPKVEVDANLDDAKLYGDSDASSEVILWMPGIEQTNTVEETMEQMLSGIASANGPSVRHSSSVAVAKTGRKLKPQRSGKNNDGSGTAKAKGRRKHRGHKSKYKEDAQPDFDVTHFVLQTPFTPSRKVMPVTRSSPVSKSSKEYGPPMTPSAFKPDVLQLSPDLPPDLISSVRVIVAAIAESEEKMFTFDDVFDKLCSIFEQNGTDVHSSEAMQQVQYMTEYLMSHGLLDSTPVETENCLIDEYLKSSGLLEPNPAEIFRKRVNEAKVQRRQEKADQEEMYPPNDEIKRRRQEQALHGFDEESVSDTVQSSDSGNSETDVDTQEDMQLKDLSSDLDVIKKAVPPAHVLAPSYVPKSVAYKFVRGPAEPPNPVAVLAAGPWSTAEVLLLLDVVAHYPPTQFNWHWIAETYNDTLIERRLREWTMAQAHLGMIAESVEEQRKEDLITLAEEAGIGVGLKEDFVPLVQKNEKATQSTGANARPPWPRPVLTLPPKQAALYTKIVNIMASRPNNNERTPQDILKAMRQTKIALYVEIGGRFKMRTEWECWHRWCVPYVAGPASSTDTPWFNFALSGVNPFETLGYICGLPGGIELPERSRVPKTYPDAPGVQRHYEHFDPRPAMALFGDLARMVADEEWSRVDKSTFRHPTSIKTIPQTVLGSVLGVPYEEGATVERRPPFPSLDNYPLRESNVPLLTRRPTPRRAPQYPNVPTGTLGSKERPGIRAWFQNAAVLPRAVNNEVGERGAEEDEKGVDLPPHLRILKVPAKGMAKKTVI